MKLKNLLLSTLSTGLLFGSGLSPLAAALIFEDFNSYADAPLQGQGPWLRAPNTDDPSLHIVVSGGAALFDWTTPAALNQGLRNQWADDAIATGSVYAIFDLNVTTPPLPWTDPDANARPGFFAFDRSGGGQYRGMVALRAGNAPDTFQIGVSGSTGTEPAYTFYDVDLALNQTYQIMVGFSFDDTKADVWLNTTNPGASPVASSNAASNPTNIRRAVLTLNNSGGLDNRGVFTLDNLELTPVPEPAHVALVFALAALAAVGLVRRFRRAG